MEVSMIEKIENTGLINNNITHAALGELISQKKEAPADEAEQGKNFSNNTLKKIVENIQEQINVINSSLSFQVYGNDKDRMAIVVSDKETGKIIREIPSKEVQQMQTKLDELIGLIFNGLA